MKKEVPTSEPISINLTSSPFPDEDTYIYVDDILYATLEGISVLEVDQEKVAKWVEETYFEKDYKNSEYNPTRLSGEAYRFIEELYCGDFLDRLDSKHYFEIFLDDMDLRNDFDPKVLFQVMKEEAAHRHIILRDEENWDYETHMTKFYNKKRNKI